jgi:decaprenyl-phosphate phosphoribosyltransferase
MKIWLRALRVRQWNKQALISLPLIVLGDQVQISDLGKLFVVTIAFSLVASSIYIFNDLQDLANDRLDAVKSQRPFASGQISSLQGGLVGILLVLLGFLGVRIALGTTGGFQVFLCFFLYFASNVLYSKLHLKRFRIIGLIIVSLGFSIRFSIGTFVLNLAFSTWAFVLIMLLAMFMLSGKRFQTFLRSSHAESGASELQFWLLSMVTFGAFFAATYSGFISDPEVVNVWGREALIISVLPLGIGLVRFVELVTHPEKYLHSDATESMTQDLFLLISVSFFVFILFMGRISIFT